MIDRHTIKHLISDRGTEVTFRRLLGGGSSNYDPGLGGTTGGGKDDEIIKVVFTNYSEREVNDTNIQRGDRRVLMSNFDVSNNELNKAPRVDDQFVGESSTVTVVDAQTLKDGGVVIGYTCQVRE